MVNPDKCGELVARCFQARTDAHFAHLMTRSYAKHVALSGFYDGIVGLADSFAEAAQGRAGALLKYPKVVARNDVLKPDTLVSTLRAWIDDNRDCCDESELQNIIDEIVSLCDSTLYKLEFLS